MLGAWEVVSDSDGPPAESSAAVAVSGPDVVSSIGGDNLFEILKKGMHRWRINRRSRINHCCFVQFVILTIEPGQEMMLRSGSGRLPCTDILA